MTSSPDLTTVAVAGTASNGDGRYFTTASSSGCTPCHSKRTHPRDTSERSRSEHRRAARSNAYYTHDSPQRTSPTLFL